MPELNTNSPGLIFVIIWYVACMENYVANKITAKGYCYLNCRFIIQMYVSYFLLLEI